MQINIMNEHVEFELSKTKTDTLLGINVIDLDGNDMMNITISLNPSEYNELKELLIK